MKTIKHTIGLLAVVFILTTVSGCKKDFDKINDDPNSPKDVPNSFILTGAQKGVMDFTCDYWWNGYVGNQLAQYWASNSYTEESRYLFRPGITNNYWTYFYAGGPNDASTLGVDVGGLEELQTIINNCTTSPAKYSVSGDPKNQIAVATALKVWLVQNMTDTWGSMPYSEALQGVKNPQPKYDKQEDIYNAIIAELDAAYTNINDAGEPVQGDVIYGGDISKWKKFMNSLKLRLAIRIADVNPGKAATMITEATAGGVFTSNADNALLNYQSGPPNFNPLYHEFTELNRKDFCASASCLDKLYSLNDPRIGLYYNKATATDSFVGRPFGQNDVNASTIPISGVSQTSDLIRSATFPGIYLDYAQVEFMLAEAAERGIGGVSDPATHYVNGITNSIQFWSDQDVLNGGAGVAGGDITTYLAQPSVAYATATGDWRQKIGSQKWIALYMQGVQGWIEYRRLDFTGLLIQPVDGALVGSGIPNRMLYPVAEQTLNPKGYASGVSQMGSDDQDTKVWWDVPH